MPLIDSSSFLEFFGSFPYLVSRIHISLKNPIHHIRHPLSKLGNCTSTDSVDIDAFFVVELMDEGEDIPEEISDLELQFIVIGISERIADFLNLVDGPIYVVVDRRLSEPTVVETIALLEPEES